MAFVANTAVTTMTADGIMLTYGPGDVIADFSDWSFAARQAHLSLGSVREEGATRPGNIDIVDGRMSMGVRTVPQLEEVTLSHEVTQPLPEPSVIDEGFACGVCAKTFARPMDLKKHMTRMHRN